MGMQKITMIVRGVLKDGLIYAFDEPLTSLDSKSRKKVIKMLMEVLKDKTLIIIKQVFNCDCYDMCIQEPKYFVIAGTRITSEYIIHELIKQGYKIDCKHVFIEGFEQSIDIDYQFNIIQSS